jgi:hypothetical protein
MINSVAHHNYIILLQQLPNLVSSLCDTLELKLERTVDLGPFKHKVLDMLLNFSYAEIHSIGR